MKVNKKYVLVLICIMIVLITPFSTILKSISNYSYSNIQYKDFSFLKHKSLLLDNLYIKKQWYIRGVIPSYYIFFNKQLAIFPSYVKKVYFFENNITISFLDKNSYSKLLVAIMKTPKYRLDKLSKHELNKFKLCIQNKCFLYFEYQGLPFLYSEKATGSTMYIFVDDFLMEIKFSNHVDENILSQIINEIYRAVIVLPKPARSNSVLPKSVRSKPQ